MRKNVRKLITLCALCVLLVSLAIPTAFAGYQTSTATVNFGSNKMAEGGERTLYGVSVSGTVKSETNTTSSGVTGYLWTKGAIWEHMRDSAYVTNTNSESLYWSNPDAENGKFWAECQASGGDHAGYCQVTQEIPDVR